MTPITWSFHTHSVYCDGEGTLDQVVESALGAGLTELGFSSHAPLPFRTGWTMEPDRLEAYRRDVRRLQAKYADRIALFLGAELDYMREPWIAEFQRSHILKLDFDYFVGSVHFLGQADPPQSFDGTEAEFRNILKSSYSGDMRVMSEDYYRRLVRVPLMPGVKVLAHLDLIRRWNAHKAYFDESAAWYREQVEEALQALAGSGVLVELNTAGWRKGLGEQYPSTWILGRCRDLDIPITVSADAHSPGQLTWQYDRALTLLDSLGIEPVNPASRIRPAAQAGPFSPAGMPSMKRRQPTDGEIG